MGRPGQQEMERVQERAKHRLVRGWQGQGTSCSYHHHHCHHCYCYCWAEGMVMDRPGQREMGREQERGMQG